MKIKHLIYPWLLSAASAMTSFREEALAVLQEMKEENTSYETENGLVKVNVGPASYSFSGSSTDTSLLMSSDSRMDDAPSSFFHATDSKGATINSIERKGYTTVSISDPVTGMVHTITKDPSGKTRAKSKKSEDYAPPLSFNVPEELLPKDDVSDESDSGRNMQEDGSFLDIMVPWTKLAECKHSGLSKGCNVDSSTRDAMMSLVHLCIMETNVAFQNSGVNTVLRLVHAYRDSVVEEDQMGVIQFLEAVTYNAGLVDDVHEKREAKGADIVAVLGDFVSRSGICGIAWVGPFKDFMYSLTDHTCATGRYVFGHEVGHNLGCLHDRGTDDGCGAPGYNWGWRDPQARFHTIMSYGCAPNECDNNPANGVCNTIQYFSSSTIKYQGLDTGDANNDNSRQINDVLVEVANYYAPVQLNPTVSPSPTNAITFAPTPFNNETFNCYGCDPGQSRFDLEILTDDYSDSENAWYLLDRMFNFYIFETAPQRNKFYQYSFCLDEMEYGFFITDTWGDGICCGYGEGYYEGKLNGEVVFQGGAFGEDAWHTFNATDDCPDEDPWTIGAAQATYTAPFINVTHSINEGPSAFYAELYEKDCSTSIDPNEIVALDLQSSIFIPSSFISFKLLIDDSKLSSSQIIDYNDPEKSSGIIEFCTKAITQTSVGLNMASKKTKFSVGFDLSNIGFTVGEITIEEEEAQDLAFGISFSISACACDLAGVCIPDDFVYTQGSSAPELRICITPSSPNLEIKNMNLELANDNGDHDPVEYGTNGPETDEVTFLLEDNDKLIVVTRIPEFFFDGMTSLSASGTCLLESKNKKNDLGDAEFLRYEIDIPIVKTPEEKMEGIAMGCLQRIFKVVKGLFE